jgi:hypothetical protein
MIRFILPFAAASFALSAPALAQDKPAPVTFTHEGVTYVYTATQQGKSRVIVGTTSTGSNFRLTVRNRMVDGYVGQTHVTFVAPRKKAGTEVASAR